VQIVSYRSERGVRAGVLRDGQVVDAWDVLETGSAHQSVRELLERGLLDRLAAEVRGGGTPLEEVQLAPPLPDPDKIVCIGLNYRKHAAEAGIDPPAAPTFFAKFRNALAAHGAHVTLPSASEQVDYEAEVAFVIGRRCRDVAEAEDWTTSPATCCSTTCRRAISSSPRRNGCRARSSTSRLRAARRS
jgi:2-keto-4-pentenoate hydratase/2-oxohepta-3-ene-1,7-dioic acid hydratase in catechol pathway